MANKHLYGGSPSMPREVRDKMASKIGNQSKVGKNDGQISGLSEKHNINAWSKWASDNSGGRDYNAGDHREAGPFEAPPKLRGRG